MSALWHSEELQVSEIKRGRYVGFMWPARCAVLLCVLGRAFRRRAAMRGKQHISPHIRFPRALLYKPMWRLSSSVLVHFVIVSNFWGYYRYRGTSTCPHKARFTNKPQNTDVQNDVTFVLKTRSKSSWMLQNWSGRTRGEEEKKKRLCTIPPVQQGIEAIQQLSIIFWYCG